MQVKTNMRQWLNQNKWHSKKHRSKKRIYNAFNFFGAIMSFKDFFQNIILLTERNLLITRKTFNFWPWHMLFITKCRSCVVFFLLFRRKFYPVTSSRYLPFRLNRVLSDHGWNAIIVIYITKIAVYILWGNLPQCPAFLRLCVQAFVRIDISF